MLFRKKGWFIFNLISFLLVGILLFGLASFLKYQSAQILYAVCPNVNEEGRDLLVLAEVQEPDAQRVNNSNFVFDVTLTKMWLEDERNNVYGTQYDITFTNHSSKNLENWRMSLITPPSCVLDSYWSGTFNFVDDTLTIHPLDYNSTIEAGKNITFGFIMMTHVDSFHFSECTIEFYRETKLWEHPLFWILLLYLVVVLLADLVSVITYFRLRKYKQREIQDQHIINQSLQTFANIIDAKDEYTKGHSLRVSLYSREIARRMGMSADDVQNVYYIALLHDIGKIGITDNILTKPGALTADERNVIKQHVTIGGEILKDFSSISNIVDGALYHHERFDGSGYAAGLKGVDIPLVARIICVADSFDAMSSARCYRKAMSMDYIEKELKENAGKQFDPAIVEYMLEMMRDGFAPASV
ncbi:MAG: HD domain-containing protein [Lachnospiraceae bacterium]|nr:HD domain-containing protein [Lachnospiraceae bacterium]